MPWTSFAAVTGEDVDVGRDSSGASVSARAIEEDGVPADVFKGAAFPLPAEWVGKASPGTSLLLVAVDFVSPSAMLPAWACTSFPLRAAAIRVSLLPRSLILGTAFSGVRPDTLLGSAVKPGLTDPDCGTAFAPIEPSGISPVEATEVCSSVEAKGTESLAGSGCSLGLAATPTSLGKVGSLVFVVCVETCLADSVTAGSVTPGFWYRSAADFASVPVVGTGAIRAAVCFPCFTLSSIAGGWIKGALSPGADGSSFPRSPSMAAGPLMSGSLNKDSGVTVHGVSDKAGRWCDTASAARLSPLLVCVKPANKAEPSS